MRIAALLDYLNGEQIPYAFSGNPEEEFESFSSLGRYKPGSLTWVKAEKNIPEGFDLSQIALAVVSEGVAGNFRNAVYTPQSKRAFFSAIERFYGETEARPAVGHFTYLSPKVKLGNNVRIGHNCTLDGDITIGDNTVIWNNVVIVNRVTIGKNCEIQSGTIIGHDGYGYTEDEAHKKTMIRHFGGVRIGDDVRIGMNNVIARGVIDDTVLKSGVKMGDLCHIGHNNQADENVSFVTGCIVYGSCHIHENAYIATSVLRNQSVVGEDAFIGMGAVVVRDVDKGQIVVGNPAKPFALKT
ncbi:MAG: hypothetical protein IJK52_05280 [Oscillospiraceae bacterium]|nr:hypothetical protein [Oscillospiraceae bacterium]